MRKSSLTSIFKPDVVILTSVVDGGSGCELAKDEVAAVLVVWTEVSLSVVIVVLSVIAI